MYIIEEINQKLNEFKVDGIHLHATQIDILCFNLVCVIPDSFSGNFLRIEIPLKFGEIDRILDDKIQLETFLKDIVTDIQLTREDELKEIRDQVRSRCNPNLPISILRHL